MHIGASRAAQLINAEKNIPHHVMTPTTGLSDPSAPAACIWD
jgi:hypothetical protein